MLEKDENIKFSKGILIIRSKSGTSRIVKVLVESKRGNAKNQIKCRFLQYVPEKSKPSKIPILIKNYNKENIDLENFRTKSISESAKMSSDSKIPILKKLSQTLRKPKKKTQFSLSNTPEDLNSSALENPKCEGFEEPSKTLSKHEVSKKILSEIIGPFQNVPRCSSEDTMPFTDIEEISVSDRHSSSISDSNETLPKSDSLESARKTQIPTSNYTAEDTMPSSEIEEISSSQKHSSSLQSITVPKLSVIKQFTSDISLFKQKSITNKLFGKKRYEEEVVVLAQYEAQKNPTDTNKKIDEVENETWSEDYHYRYIDSGLRRLRSEESKLILDEFYNRRHHVRSLSPSEDEVEPILGEIPSDIFKKEKEKPDLIPKHVPSSSSITDEEESEEEEEKEEKGEEEKEPEPELVPKTIKDLPPEEEKKEEEPPKDEDDVLARLKQFEDVKYIVDFTKPKDDFCLHTKELPSNILNNYSELSMKDSSPYPSESTEDLAVIPVRLPIANICIHTEEPPGSGVCSSSTCKCKMVSKKQLSTSLPNIGVHTKNSDESNICPTDSTKSEQFKQKERLLSGVPNICLHTRSDETNVYSTDDSKPFKQKECLLSGLPNICIHTNNPNESSVYSTDDSKQFKQNECLLSGLPNICVHRKQPTDSSVYSTDEGQCKSKGCIPNICVPIKKMTKSGVHSQCRHKDCLRCRSPSISVYSPKKSNKLTQGKTQLSKRKSETKETLPFLRPTTFYCPTVIRNKSVLPFEQLSEVDLKCQSSSKDTREEISTLSKETYLSSTTKCKNIKHLDSTMDDVSTLKTEVYPYVENMQEESDEPISSSDSSNISEKKSLKSDLSDSLRTMPHSTITTYSSVSQDSFFCNFRKKKLLLKSENENVKCKSLTSSVAVSSTILNNKERRRIRSKINLHK